MHSVQGIDHVQVAIPVDAEEQAIAFYGGLLGLVQVPKPTALAGRGGAWFELPDGRGLHLGIEADFRPAAKAHPALVVLGFDALRALLEDAEAALGEVELLEGRRRCHVLDPFGNRLELVSAD